MTNTLKPPPIGNNPDAIEVARIWYLPPHAGVQVAFRADLKDPAAWGVVLAEMTHQVARLFIGRGISEEAAVAAIHHRYDREMHKHFPSVPWLACDDDGAPDEGT